MTESQNIEFISAKRLRVWGWPAVANFVMGGAAAGLCLVYFPLEIFQADSLPVTIKLLPLFLALAGFSALAVEADKPLRARFFVSNLRTSWMSREILAGGAFISSLVMDLLYQGDIFHILVALSSLFVLISQGLIFSGARALRSWSSPLVPALFITSSLSSGAGIALIVPSFEILAVNGYFRIAALVVVTLELATWVSFLYPYSNEPLRQETKALRSLSYSYFALGLGNLLPIVLIANLFTGYVDKGSPVQHYILVLSGIAMVAGSIWKKGGVILAANYLRPIMATLPMTESRDARNL